MNYQKITNEKFQQLIRSLLNEKWNIVAPDKSGVKFSPVTSPDELVIDPASAPTNASAKEYVFPKTEPLFFYKKQFDDLELVDPIENNNGTVLLGVKPCDAAGIPVLSKVFNWDYKDDFFNKKVERTIVIGISCEYRDEYCFCTSVGLDPENERGSDIFLKSADDTFFVKAVTEKGSNFIEKHKDFFESSNEAEYQSYKNPAAPPAQKFDSVGVKSWLDNNFENEYWKTPGELCLGCAQCAFVCPVCHCFDIVDETCGYDCGRRMKNWDACQFGLFTKHASGHNPRDDQGARYRQRVSHKFKYYKDKFDEILCTGCGRCSRGCAVGIDIAEIVMAINGFQNKEVSVS